MLRVSFRPLTLIRRPFHKSVERFNGRMASGKPEDDGGIDSMMASILAEIAAEGATAPADPHPTLVSKQLDAEAFGVFNSNEMNLLSQTNYRDQELDLDFGEETYKLSLLFGGDIFKTDGPEAAELSNEALWDSDPFSAEATEKTQTDRWGSETAPADPFAFSGLSANPFSFDLDPLADSAKSFKEREIFNSIFSDLLRDGPLSNEREANPRQAVFDGASSTAVVRDLVEAHSAGELSTSVSYLGYDEKRRSEVAKLNATLRESLIPTFQAMDGFATSDELLTFLNVRVVKAFMDLPAPAKLLLDGVLKSRESPLKPAQSHQSKTTETLALIKSQSETSPESPLVNDLTLPLLLNHALEALGFRLDAPEEAVTVFNNLKRNLELYTYGVTAETYNVMLKLSWLNFRSLYDIEVLLKEMISNGIAINPEAHTIVFRVLIDSYRQLKGDPANGIRAVWSEEDVSRTYTIRQLVGYQ